MTYWLSIDFFGDTMGYFRYFQIFWPSKHLNVENPWKSTMCRSCSLHGKPIKPYFHGENLLWGVRHSENSEKQVSCAPFSEWPDVDSRSFPMKYDLFPCGYESIPINTIFRGMNIHLPAILMFTRGTRFWHTATYRFWGKKNNTL